MLAQEWEGERVLPRLGLARLLAICTSALLAVVVGLTAGFAARSGAESTLPAPTWCPTTPPATGGDPGPCPDPSTGGPRERVTPTTPPTDLPLRALAEQRGLKIGSAVNNAALADERYRAVLGREFQTVTAENVMKWSTLEPTPGEYDRTEADRLIEFAQHHQQQVYGHTLVWHRQTPAWLHGPEFDDQRTRDVLREYITEQVSYFRGQVWAWDVINEALHDDGTMRDSLWLRRLGPDYVADAFRWARAADPDAALFINDFGIEGINAKSDSLYALVKRLRAQGAPIDGVGFQVHWTLDPLPASFIENLQRFAALGVDVAITELDVRMPEPVTPETLAQQAEIYAEAVASCLSVHRCVSVTVWGFTDAYSWVPHAYPDKGAAAMFDQDLRPKPAYSAVAETLRRP